MYWRLKSATFFKESPTQMFYWEFFEILKGTQVQI